MVCPKCGSTNVNVQAVSESQLKNKHHGFFWWIFIGWWWLIIKWFCFTIPALIVKIFVPKRQKLKTQHFAMCVCQNCGNSWKA
jgi:predicted nucleic-acid-binding Zn-ribbon protein